MSLQARRTTTVMDAIREPRRVQTEGKWLKCGNAECGQSLFIKDVERNWMCCKHCNFHFRMGSRQRVDSMLDPGSWMEILQGIESSDPLNFQGKRSYRERLKDSQAKTGLKDAVICGEGKIEGRDLVLVVMDFFFMGGSMGSAVGEKITRAIEHATQKRLPVVIVCCSGGARMDEGALSLMQMAKTSAAVQRQHDAGLPYITLLTDPTMGGVSASFAFLGDIILAEPGAMIGFAGARVIEQTIKDKLPESFQTAGFLLKHGQVDKVVERKELRSTLAKILTYAFGAGRPEAVETLVVEDNETVAHDGTVENDSGELTAVGGFGPDEPLSGIRNGNGTGRWVKSKPHLPTITNNGKPKKKKAAAPAPRASKSKGKPARKR